MSGIKLLSRIGHQHLNIKLPTQAIKCHITTSSSLGLQYSSTLNALESEAPRQNRFEGKGRGFSKKENLDEDESDSSRPLSRSYFTGNSTYYDLITGLDQCLLSYTNKEPFFSTKPTYDDIQPYKERTVFWLSHRAMKSYLKIDLTQNQYRAIVARLDRLVGIDPKEKEKLPLELRDYIAKLSQSGTLEEKQHKAAKLDSLNRAYAVGKRKEASVRCWLVKGDGKVMINGQPLADHFKRLLDRETCLYPLALTNNLKSYNAWIIALGGGTTGQCQAISLALSKALVIHQPELEAQLSEAKLLTRDPRVVERKKTGQPKARKKFTWVKR